MKPLNCKVLMEANDIKIVKPGAGYSVGEMLTFNVIHEDTVKPVKLRVSQVDENGSILRYDLIDRGTYQTISLEMYSVNNWNSEFLYDVVITNGGTNYQIGDKLIGGDFHDSLKFTVTSVDEIGAIENLQADVNKGPHNIELFSVPLVGGSGNGAYVDIISEGYTPSVDDAAFIVDWRLKDVTIEDYYYMYTYPYITYEYNTNGEVTPVVDCKGYLQSLSITNKGNGFAEQPKIMVNGLSESEIYYKVWKGEIVDEIRMKNMTDTISHFEKLGYNIQRRENPNTGNTFEWVITWNS